MKVLIVCSGNSQNRVFINEQVSSLSRLGVEFEIFLITGKGVFSYLKSLKSLKAVIEAGRHNLAHAHFGLSGMLSILQRRIPTVVTYHGSDINLLRCRMVSLFTTFFSDWNIFVSRELYEKVYIKPKRYSIIPCGVDLRLFYPIDKNYARKALGLSFEKKYILFSSSFDNKCKNYLLAKKALELIEGATLLELSGFPREKVNLFLNACDLLLMTSSREGSPQVIKEAMACNCPIVSTDVGDVKEVIGDTEGCYIASFEPKNVANKIMRSLDFSKRTNGRDRIGHLEINNIAKKILQIYKTVLREE